LGEGKNFLFTGKGSFSPLPNPLPFSRKAEYRAAPLSRLDRSNSNYFLFIYLHNRLNEVEKLHVLLQCKTLHIFTYRFTVNFTPPPLSPFQEKRNIVPLRWRGLCGSNSNYFLFIYLHNRLNAVEQLHVLLHCKTLHIFTYRFTVNFTPPPLSPFQEKRNIVPLPLSRI